MLKRSLSVFLLACFLAFFALTTLLLADDHHHVRQPEMTPQNSGTTEGLIAVSPVDSHVVWASGRGGTFVRTTDGGKTWTPGVVPGAEALEFRDVQGVSDQVAYLQSIGNNTSDFRIYKTLDGGATWTMQFQNQTMNAFYDCFAFWTPKRGISHSDSVNGVFPDLRTKDGKTWKSISGNMPPALPGEFSFASSGTCVATEGDSNAWIVTGGGTSARALVTRDGGNTWNAYDTPLVSSGSAGAFTVAFRDGRHGIVGGGDLDPTDPNNARTATSSDGGQTWTLTSAPPVTGAIFGLGYVSGAGLGLEGGRGSRDDWGGNGCRGEGDWGHDGEDDCRAVVITADTGGAAWTPDEGATWFSLPSVNGYWAVAFANPKAGWLVGINGQILKISF
jgi:photosystem II stability/assembly factor-like uncharacterized protein